MTTYTSDARALGRVERRWLLALALVPFVLQVAGALSPYYSYFIDEFYYLACARRPALGYVDHPPLAPWFLAATSLLHHQSLLGIRVLAGLGQVATVWMTGLLAWRFGGGRTAVIGAALAVLCCPIFLGITSFYSMNAFEPLLWTLVTYALVRLVQTGNRRLWLLVGLLIGLCFLNKHTVTVFVVGLAVGVVVTRARTMLRDPWMWAGCAVALAVAAPNLAWQAWNGWPSLEFYRAAQSLKNVYSPPWQSLLVLVIVVNLALAPWWMAGTWRLVRGVDRRWAFLGVGAAVAIVSYVFSGSSRPDRPFAVFPTLFAAGALWFEDKVAARSAWRWLAAPIVAIGLLLLPPSVPLLPPPMLASYVRSMGLQLQMEKGKRSPLPQTLADRTGWESFLDDVTRVYRSLPPEDQRRAVIYVPDYGHAGAIELWGPSRGLPPVISGHNTYWFWSQGHTDSDVLIAVLVSAEDLHRGFREVRLAGWSDCEYCMSWRSHMPIFVAKGPVTPLSTIWPTVRHFE